MSASICGGVIVVSEYAGIRAVPVLMTALKRSAPSSLGEVTPFRSTP